MSFNFPDRLPPGAVVDDFYEVEGLLGSGGFADVYSGVQRDTGMQIAIKVLRPVYGQSTRVTFEQRFLQEARLAASLRHPNVVTILACRESMTLRLPSGQESSFPRFYIVMERLAGSPLDKILEEGPMDPERASRLVIECLDGLAQGHKRGIVHKDIKPANLFLINPGERTETLKILDYGIARVGQAQDEQITQTGEAVFTPQYAAPEYITDLIADPTVDVYQMGLVLAEMLTGRPIVQGETAFACMLIHSQGVTLPAEVLASPLGPILELATALDPKERYPDAGAFCKAIEGARPSLPLPDSGASLRSTGDAPPDETAPRDPVLTLLEPAAEPLPQPPTLREAPKEEEAPGSGLSKGLIVGALGVLSMGLLLLLGVGGAIVFVLDDKTPQTNLKVRCPAPMECFQSVSSLKKAAKTFKSACEEGDVVACNDLGFLYRRGVGVDYDPKQASELFDRACAAGVAVACANLGVNYDVGVGVEQDSDKAFGFLEEACGKGSAYGCMNLGFMYEHGRSGPRDYDKANELYNSACKANQPLACYFRAKLYLEGKGVLQDAIVGNQSLRKARKLYKKGCDKKAAASCNNLGYMNAHGEGGDKDIKRARELWERACDADYAQGCSNLGTLYSAGSGVERDTGKARRLFKKACRRGDETGCHNERQLDR